MSTPLTLYIAGPMTGLLDYNRPAFFHADGRLRNAGYLTLNPARHEPDDDLDWTDYVRAGLSDVLRVDGIAVLPGWECSRGARLEVDVAHALRLPVLPVEQWIAR